MLKIVRVGSLENDTIDIQLDNGNIIMLELTNKLQDPAFTVLLEDDRLAYPKTDGERVFWRGGPSLTLNEIFELLGTTENNINRAGKRQG